MSTAYILINCDLGKDESVIEDLGHIESVKDVHGTFGAYDVLAKIEHERKDILREVITWNIRRIDYIRSMLTLMGTEDQS